MSESIIWVESIEKFVIADGTHEPGDQSMWGTYYSTGDDPYMVSIGHRIASEFPTVSITMAAEAGGQTWAEFFFLTDDEGRWDENKLQTFEVIGDGEMHTSELGMSTIPRWTGVITALRVVPVGTANTAITIDRISIGN